jgi:ADP-ribose pyrophosphatase
MPKKSAAKREKPQAVPAGKGKKSESADRKPAGKAKRDGKEERGGKDKRAGGSEKLLSSVVVYQGKLFRVLHDKLIEPSGKRSERDVIRHHGSVVILAIDKKKSKKDPRIVMERQYRHAALRYMWELPAGKLEPGEEPLAGAQRELEEETGYGAKKWRPLVEYFGSPGFLGESMKVFVAEGLTAGEAHPEEDEQIEFRLMKLSVVLKMIERGEIVDGKTLTSVLLYARRNAVKRKK